MKKTISLLVLILYIHGLSGYTMNFHKCTITGFEKVYTSYSQNDPCGEEENECDGSADHFEQADCCDLQQTNVSIDDDGYTSYFKTHFQKNPVVFRLFHFIQDPGSIPGFSSHSIKETHNKTGPPEPADICVFRI